MTQLVPDLGAQPAHACWRRRRRRRSPVPRRVRSRPRPTVDRIARQRDRQARRRRRGLVALLLVLLLTTGVAVAGWYLTTGRFTSTPALASLTQAEAERVADRAGLGIAFTEDYSESVPRGAVIETDPSAGSKILKGGRMTATVSQGPERVRDADGGRALPRGGRDRDAAGEPEPGRGQREVQRHRPGRHRDQRVEEARRSLRRDTRIDLVVSKGPAPIPIKNYVGKKFDTAAAALRKAGFTVVAERKHSDEVAKGLVLAQDPKSGQGQRGDTVTLTESLGPVMVQVPNVARMGVKAAREGDGGRRLQDPGPTGRGQLPRARLRRLHRPARLGARRRRDPPSRCTSFDRPVTARQRAGGLLAVRRRSGARRSS